MGERVAILGASDDPLRYAHRAMRALRGHGHTVLPVNPRLTHIDGIAVEKQLGDLAGTIDTVTVYLRPELAEPLADEIVKVRPRRVIFNPGSESHALRARLEAEGIAVQWQCTLVLLREGRYAGNR